MKIYYVRHGQTDLNLAKKMQGGGTEKELNETGISQANETRKELENVKYDIVICSPMYRAKQTAEIINQNRNVQTIIDERIREIIKPQEISLGDFVLTGGELPALCLIDAISRKIDGTLGKIESADEDSFSNGLLEYPHYTKPREYRGLKVPDVLLNGNHKEINEFRLQKSLERTKTKRPDLYEKFKTCD